MSLLDTEMNEGFTCSMDVEEAIPAVEAEIPAVVAEIPSVVAEISAVGTEIPADVAEIPAVEAEMIIIAEKNPDCVELKLTVLEETLVVKKIPDYAEKKTDIPKETLVVKQIPNYVQKKSDIPEEALVVKKIPDYVEKRTAIPEENPIVAEKVLEVRTVMDEKPDSVDGLLVTRQIVPDCVVELTIVGQQIRDCVAEIPVVQQQSSRCERKIPVVRQEVPDCAVRIPIVEQEMSDCVENISLAADTILSGPDGSSIVVESIQVISVGTNSVVDSSTSDLDEIPDDADETRGHVDEIPAFADEIPDVINILRSHVDGLHSITRELPTVVERLPDVYNPEPLALEEEPWERTDDDTLLDFLRHASPYPAAEFLKRPRSFSQATLNAALILACQHGFKYLVQKLVHLGADIECRDSGKTPLLICVENNYFDLVRFLVAREADVKAVDFQEANVLILCIRFGRSMEMLHFLLEKADIMINHQDSDGYRAVMKAFEFMNVGAANLLLNSYHSQRFNESTCSFESCWALLDQAFNYSGMTAQQIAEHCGLGDVFKLLKGFASKEKSKIQTGAYTCFHENLACWFNSEIEARKDCVEAMLDVYRDTYESGELSFTNEEMASIRRFLQNVSDMNWEVRGYLKSSHVSIAVDAGDYNLVKLLCQLDAPLNQSMHGSEKLPLSVAAKYGRMDFVELLLKYKADVNTRSFRNSPLDCALIHGHTDCAEFLVNHGANMDLRSAFVSAMKYQSSKYVQFLFRNYHSETVKCVLEEARNGNNLLVEAVQRGNLEIIEQILQAGVDVNEPQLSGVTPIAESKNGAVAQFLIHCDGDVSHVTVATNETPLMHVLRKLYSSKTDSCPEEVFQLLLENGDSVNGFTSKETWKIQEGVYTCDHENLACWFHSEIEARKDCVEAILDVYRATYESGELSFTNEEMASISRFLQNVSDVNWEVRGYLKSSHVCIAVDAGDYNLVELLCQHGAPLNQSMHGSEKLPLSVAAKYGRMDLVELLLKYKADVNTRSFRNSPLDCALIHGHIDCAEFLVNHGTNMDIKSAFLSAMKYQSSKYVQFLFRNYQSETVKCVLEEARHGNNFLVEAVQRGNLEIIEQILQAGVDFNEPQLSGATPIAESKNGAVAQFLIRCGADVSHVTGATNETPLMHVLRKLCSCRTDSCPEEVFRLLLENGASVNAKSSDGTTPLMLAARGQDREVILQTLLEHGANCSHQDNDGNTALLHALLESNSKNAMILIQNMKDNIDLLNLQNNQGFTALMCASSTGEVHSRADNVTVMSELIDSGADVNITDVNGDSALFHAVKSFSAKKSHVKVLINAGCHVNLQNNEGLSPLMIAASNFEDFVPMLIDAGADVNAVSHKDSTKTAISFVVFSEDYYQPWINSCLHLLLDKGAKSSYSSSVLLSSLITGHQPELIPKLIKSGLGPFEVNIDDIPVGVHQRSMLPSVSPLCLALLVDNTSLARYFWRNLFLTNADMSSLPSNRIVRHYLQSQGHEECLSFLDEVFSQPMSLFKMCFVAVTSAIGASPERKARINKLPLPRAVKDKLLFKSDVECLTKLEIENMKRFYQWRGHHFVYTKCIYSLNRERKVIRYLDSDEDEED